MEDTSLVTTCTPWFLKTARGIGALAFGYGLQALGNKNMRLPHPDVEFRMVCTCVCLVLTCQA